MMLLLRLFTTISVIVLACILGLWMSNHPGELQLDWMGYRLSIKLWVVLITLVCVCIIGALLLALLMRGLHFFSSLGARRGLKHYRNGLEALTHTVAALSLSDYTNAKKHLAQSHKYLGEQLPLNTLLRAHIASRTGNQAEALRALESMQAFPETRFVALARLSSLSNQAGDSANALLYAKEAFLLRPTHHSSAMDYFSLLIKSGAYVEAHALLKGLRDKRVITKEQERYLQSRLYVSQVKQDSQGSDNVYLMEQAFINDPSFSETYNHLQNHLHHGSGKQAFKLLFKAWKINPHPVLIDLLLDAIANFPATVQMKHAFRLASAHPQHIESHIGIARVALQAQQWELARNHLKAALNMAPQARIFRLLAILEDNGCKDTAAAALWLRRLNDAQPDPVWHCNTCGYHTSQWAAHCDACGSFDSYVWGQGNPQYPPMPTVDDTLAIG